MSGTSFVAACALSLFFSSQPSANKANSSAKSLPDNSLLQLGTAQFRQGSPVTMLTVSPDGTLIASAGEDGSVWLWDAASGKLAKRLHTGPAKATALAFSANSKYVAFAYLVPGLLAEVHIVDAAGKVSSIIPARVDIGYPLAVAADGKNIAVGDGNKVRLTNYVLETAGGDAPGPRYLDCGQQAQALTFSADGKQLTIAVSDGTVQQWNVEGHKVQTWGKNALPANLNGKLMAYCPANKQFLALSEFNEMQIWDAPNAKPEAVALKAPLVYLTAGTFSADGKLAAAVGYSEDMENPANLAKKKVGIVLWDAATGKMRHELGSNLPKAKSLCFGSDGKTLFTGHTDGIIRAWDVQTGTERKPESPGHQDKVAAVVYSPDSKYIFSASDDKTLRKWEVKTGKLLWTVAAGAVVTSLAIAPDGKSLATAGTDKSVRIWQTADGKEVQKLDGPKQIVTDVAYSPDGKHLAAWSKDGTLRMWDAAAGKKIYEVKKEIPDDGNAAPVPGSPDMDTHPRKGLVFSPDGKYLFTGGQNAIHMRSAATGKVIRKIYFVSAFTVSALAISVNGKNLIVSDRGGGTWLYEIATGQPRFKLTSPMFVPQPPFGQPGFSFSGGSGSGAFTGVPGMPNGFSGFAGTGGFGGFVGYQNFGVPFDPLLYSPLKPGHIGPVLGLAYSPKGKYLATAGQDRTILLWNAATSKVITMVGEHQGAVTAVAFAPDGKTLATASADTTIIIWDTAKLLAHKLDPVEKAWEELGLSHAATAYQAMQEMAGQPDKTLALLHKKLQPVKLPSKQIQQWLKDLGSGNFGTREKASKELERIAEIIEPALRDLLAKPPSVEVHLRVKQLLDKLPQEMPSATRLQQLRALELLEQMNNSKARQILQSLAVGTPEAWLTQEAQKVLKRLDD